MADTNNKFDLNIKNGVIAKLQTLGPKLEKKYLNKALQQGAAIVKAAAVSRARAFDDPSTPQAIWKEIQIYTSAQLGKQNGGVALQVGVLGGAVKASNNKASRKKGQSGQAYTGPGNVYYWRFLEFGTSKMKAQPFMRPALADNISSATDAITAGVNDGIDAVVAGN
jgi:HK97 gp10 family phage protein